MPPESQSQFNPTDQINNAPTPENTFLKRKYFGLYFVLAIVLFTLASVFLLWWINKTSNQITLDSKIILSGPINHFAGWQTYTNEKYGFEFKYPEKINGVDINPRETSQDGTLYVFLNTGVENHLADFSLIPNSTIEKELSVYKSIEKDVKNGKNKAYNKYTVTPETNVNVAGISGKQFSIIAPDMGTTRSVITLWEVSGNLYYFAYSSFDNQPYLDIYNQILSTFKFIATSTPKNNL
jgi:hypothetical protein